VRIERRVAYDIDEILFSSLQRFFFSIFKSTGESSSYDFAIDGKNDEARVVSAFIYP
jgi:hypothetical protein